jgi:hypothetical protein
MRPPDVPGCLPAYYLHRKRGMGLAGTTGAETSASLLEARPPSQWAAATIMLDAQRMFHPRCSGCITANWSTNISHGPSQRIHNEKAISSACRPVRTASWQPPSV